MPSDEKIEFDTDKNAGGMPRKILYSRFEASNIEPGLIRFLINKHIVKTERQADLLVVALFLICVAASIFIYEHTSGNSSAASKVTTADVLREISRQ